MKNILTAPLFVILSIINVLFIDYNQMIIGIIIFAIASIMASYKFSKEMIFIGTALYFATSFLSYDFKFVFASSYPLINYSIFYFLSKVAMKKYQKEQVTWMLGGSGFTEGWGLLDLIYSVTSILLLVLMTFAYSSWLPQ